MKQAGAPIDSLLQDSERSFRESKIRIIVPNTVSISYHEYHDTPFPRAAHDGIPNKMPSFALHIMGDQAQVQASELDSGRARGSR